MLSVHPFTTSFCTFLRRKLTFAVAFRTCSSVGFSRSPSAGPPGGHIDSANASGSFSKSIDLTSLALPRLLINLPYSRLP
jgi:hypothetical protein